MICNHLKRRTSLGRKTWGQAGVLERIGGFIVQSAIDSNVQVSDVQSVASSMVFVLISVVVFGDPV
jgi:hypothetical protein